MNLASYIDYTLLKPFATPQDIIKLCDEAKQFQVKAVCVNQVYVDLAAHLLVGTGIKVATVIGFPLGAVTTAVKTFETEQAVKNKADEIDMVMNLGAAKAGLWEVVTTDISEVVKSAQGKLVKVIIETCYLSEQEKIAACKAVLEAGADFVKTSTGFGSGGATLEDVKLMHQVVGGKLGIKAAGGIRTSDQAVKLIEAGATRIGTSNGTVLLG